MSIEEPKEIRKNKTGKIIDFRYVSNKKPLEPADISKAEAEDLLLDDKELGDAKAKARRVMKGFTEENILELPITAPQISRAGRADLCLPAPCQHGVVTWIPGLFPSLLFRRPDQARAVCRTA